MDIQHGKIISPALGGKLALHGAEGIVQRVHKDAAGDIHRQHAVAVGRSDHPGAHAGTFGGIVGGAENPPVVLQEGCDIPPVKINPLRHILSLS